MKLGGRTLEAWFKTTAENKKGDLKERGPEYKAQYEGAVMRLTTHVHPNVTKGAIATDGGFLTDHGPEHIRKVILRAGEMLEGTLCVLSTYETYILLMAIHFHDVGNALGRMQHEEAAQRVMVWVGEAAGGNDIEKNMILQIARAHGGVFRGDKDTVEHLTERTTLLNCHVRPRLLAAIVRFADELADDRDRASRFIMDIGAMPAEAKIFHRYAHALHSVYVDREASCVQLQFDLAENDALETFQHADGERYLLDYIFDRTLKMHVERIYCMRFLRRWGIALDSVVVQINVRGQSLEPAEIIGYRLTERGYPSSPSAGIYEMCPDLAKRADWGFNRVTGPELAKRLRG